MNNFLLKTKQLFKEFLQNVHLHKNIHLIMGNISCDLDSCVSALVLAWTKHNTQTQITSTGSTLYIPVLNIKEAELRRRTEIVFLFNLLNIHSENLVFRDHFSLEQFSNAKKFYVTLVDHHVLLSSDKDLDKHTVEIIDHRIQLREFSSRINTNIALVGSCCTLIAEILLKNVNFLIPEEICTMLLGSGDEMALHTKYTCFHTEVIKIGAILVDTNNLDPQTGKTTSRDIAIVNRLKNDRNDLDLIQFHTNLIRAKYSIDCLTTMDLILKDPKWIEGAFHKVIFSTLHQSMQEFIDRGDYENEITVCCEEYKVSAWIGLFPCTAAGSITFKPLLLKSSNASLRTKIVNELCSTTDLAIEVDKSHRMTDDFRVLRMLNVQRTRKQVLPVVDNSLKQFEANDQ